MHWRQAAIPFIPTYLSERYQFHRRIKFLAIQRWSITRDILPDFEKSRVLRQARAQEKLHGFWSTQHPIPIEIGNLKPGVVQPARCSTGSQIISATKSRQLIDIFNLLNFSPPFCHDDKSDAGVGAYKLISHRNLDVCF